MSEVDGPDFICIGMPKAGTGWLYDQLEMHPDFWMPPVKELVYLNREHPSLAFVDAHGERVKGRRERAALKKGFSKNETRVRPSERLVHRDPLHERDVAFLRQASFGHGKPMDLTFYASMFRCKGDLLSGDITPPYCNIPEETIAQIGLAFPHLKALLLIRDPVARAWSRICMAHNGGSFDTALLSDADGFDAYLRATHKVGGLFATEVWARWQQHAPNVPLGVFFFDELLADPAHARRKILTFLNADPDKPSGKLPPNYNRKVKEKLEMTSIARDILVNYFHNEILTSADVFGGPACAWPSAYRL
jgi:hypothetical protein